MPGITFSSSTTANVELESVQKVQTLANLLNFALNNSGPNPNMKAELSVEDQQDFQALLVSLRGLYQ